MSVDNNSNCKIYDMHNHIFPEKIADKAVMSIGHFYGLNMARHGVAENLIKSGSKAGIAKYLVCSTATKGEQVKAINNFIAAEAAAHPEFIGFGSLHPDAENIFSETERIISLGLKGIKLHPDFQTFNIDDEAAYPIYEAAEGRLPILFHMGDDRYEFSRPYRLLNILDRFPKLTAIAAHLGGYRRWDEALALPSYLSHPNIYIDTSSALAFMPEDKAVQIMRTHGTDRVFFGTDYPMWSHGDELKRFDALPLTSEEKEKILYKNARRFFA